MRKRHLFKALIPVVLAATLSGCSTATCSGGAQGPPSLSVDASEWLEAHSGATLVACFDGKCRKVADREVEVFYSMQPVGTKDRFKLTATGKKGDRLVLNVEKYVVVPTIAEHTACGIVRRQEANFIVTTTGQLKSAVD